MGPELPHLGIGLLVPRGQLTSQSRHRIIPQPLSCPRAASLQNHLPVTWPGSVGLRAGLVTSPPTSPSSSLEGSCQAEGTCLLLLGPHILQLTHAFYLALGRFRVWLVNTGAAVGILERISREHRAGSLLGSHCSGSARRAQGHVLWTRGPVLGDR